MPGPAGRFEWERLIRRAALEPTEKFVAMLLASYADADGSRVRPGVQRLMNVSGLSRSTIRRAIRALREKGFLEYKSYGSKSGRKDVADEYRLIFPADESVLLLGPDEEPGVMGDPWSGVSYPQPGVTHDSCQEKGMGHTEADQGSWVTEPGVMGDPPPQQDQSLHQPHEATVSYSKVEGAAPALGENSDFASPNGHYTPTRIELDAWNATHANAKETSL